MTFAKPTDAPGQPLNVIYAEHILQLIGVLTGQIDGGALQFLGQVAAPATAPTVTLSAGALNGSYEWGTYWITGAADGTGSYAVTGRTTPSPYSAAQALANQQGTVSIAGQAIPTGVVGWGVVRNQASGGTWYEVPGSEQFMNNAGVMPTSFVDNVADANLVTAAPATNTTGTYLNGYLRTDNGAPNPQIVVNQTQFDSTVLLNAVSTGWVGQLQWLYNGALKHLLYIDQSNAYQLNLRMNYNNDGSSNTLSINGNVQTYGDITAEGSANQSADHPLSALSPDGSSIWLLPSAAQGAYNALVQAGDQAIIFSNQGAPTNTSHLTIAPWFGSSAGIRIGSDGTLTTPGSINGQYTTTVNWSGTMDSNGNATLTGLPSGASNFLLMCNSTTNSVVGGHGSSSTCVYDYTTIANYISTATLSGGTLTILGEKSASFTINGLVW